MQALYESPMKALREGFWAASPQQQHIRCCQPLYRVNIIIFFFPQSLLQSYTAQAHVRTLAQAHWIECEHKPTGAVPRGTIAPAAGSKR